MIDEDAWKSHKLHQFAVDNFRNYAAVQHSVPLATRDLRFNWCLENVGYKRAFFREYRYEEVGWYSDGDWTHWEFACVDVFYFRDVAQAVAFKMVFG